MLWRESQAWSSTLTTFSQDRPDLNLGLKTGGEWEITHSDLFLVPFLPLVLKLGGVTGEGEFRMLSQYWGDSLFLLVVQHDCWSSLSGGCSSSSLLLTVSASLPHFHRHWQSLARFVYIFWFILTDGIHTIWLICMSFFFWPQDLTQSNLSPMAGSRACRRMWGRVTLFIPLGSRELRVGDGLAPCLDFSTTLSPQFSFPLCM